MGIVLFGSIFVIFLLMFAIESLAKLPGAAGTFFKSSIYIRYFKIFIFVAVAIAFLFTFVFNI